MATTDMAFEAAVGTSSLEHSSNVNAEPARRPVERIKKTLRKYTSKLQLRRPSASADEPPWDPPSAGDASDPPRYSRLRILDDYRWPICEPLEVLVLSEEHSSSFSPPADRNFSCQMTRSWSSAPAANPSTSLVSASSSSSLLPRAFPSCPGLAEESLDKLITLPCGHIFHPECLQTELRRHAYARCPRCQHTLHYRRCHHRVHIPYFAPGTAIHKDELDGACRCCAPFPFMQHVMSERGDQQGERAPVPPSSTPSSATTTTTTSPASPASIKATHGDEQHHTEAAAAATGSGFSAFFSRDEDTGAADFGWHWWALSVFEGGAERFLAERAALQRRLGRVCASSSGSGHERERRVAVLILDTLWLVYAHLRAHKGLEWPHALRLVGPIAYEEAAASCCRTAEQRGVDVWASLLDMMVERMHAFHLRGAAMWQPYELLPFQPCFPMVEDLTDGAV